MCISLFLKTLKYELGNYAIRLMINNRYWLVHCSFHHKRWLNHSDLLCWINIWLFEPLRSTTSSLTLSFIVFPNYVAKLLKQAVCWFYLYFVLSYVFSSCSLTTCAVCMTLRRLRPLTTPSAITTCRTFKESSTGEDSPLSGALFFCVCVHDSQLLSHQYWRMMKLIYCNLTAFAFLIPW